MPSNPSVQWVNCSTTSASIGPIQAGSISVPTMTTKNLFHKNTHVVTLTVANFPMFTVQTQASRQNNHHFTTNIVKLAHRNCFTKSAVKIVLFLSLWSWAHHDSSPANQGRLSIQLVNSKPTPDERASVTGWLKSPHLTLCNRRGEFSWPSHWLT